MLPRQGRTKGVHHHQALIIWNVKGAYLRTRRSKLSTIKWQKIHLYQQLNLKNKLSKQAEQKQNHRYGDYLEGYQLGGGRVRKGENVQGLRSINW